MIASSDQSFDTDSCAFLRRKNMTRRSSPTTTRKDRILDAAEALFASRGFYGVSLRDITSAAGVDVALIGYHFGTKRELFIAVFDRRAEVLNRERLERLNEARLAARPHMPTVEAIVAAFSTPLLERCAQGGGGWKNYFALVAYVNNSPEFGPLMMTHSFDPLVEKFVEALLEALPSAPAREVYWGYQFLTGALTLAFAETHRIDALSKGLCSASDFESIIERIPPFMASGFQALATRQQPNAQPRHARRKRETRRRGPP